MSSSLAYIAVLYSLQSSPAHIVSHHTTHQYLLPILPTVIPSAVLLAYIYCLLSYPPHSFFTYCPLEYPHIAKKIIHFRLSQEQESREILPMETLVLEKTKDSITLGWFPLTSCCGCGARNEGKPPQWDTDRKKKFTGIITLPYSIQKLYFKSTFFFKVYPN